MSAARLGLGVAVALGAMALGACDDDQAAGRFEVRISAEPELIGNAPLTVRLQAPNTAPLDAEPRFAWDFGGGATSAEAEPIHTFETPGEHSVAVTVRAGGAEGQARTRFTLAPPVELAVSEVSFTPRRVQAGQAVELSWRLANAGAEPAAPWRLQVFVSADEAFDPADTVILELPFEAGPVGAQGPVSVELPASLASGDWFVGVVADPAARLGDADRSNNLSFAPFSLQVRNPTEDGPDLLPCGLAIPAFDVLPRDQVPVAQQGDQLQVEVCVTNAGNGVVPRASYALYLSRDEVFDAEDLPVARRDGFALGAGDQETFTDLVELPAVGAVGAWRLLVVLDPGEAVAEQREDNNVRVWPGTFEVVEAGQVAGVDLAVAELVINESQVFWGQALTGELRLVNRGDAAVARSFVIRIFAVPVSGGGRSQLRSVNVPNFPAGGDERLALQLPVNRTIERGNYTLRAEVDPANSTGDVNPSNNQRSLLREIELGGEPDFDLAVRAAAFAPDAVDAGDPIQVTGRIENPGRDASGGFEAAVVLSADDVYDRDDPVVALFALTSVPGGEGTDVAREVVIPAALDQAVASWRVFLVADPAGRLSGERDRENNVAQAPGRLEVRGAMGGCAEDQSEPNDVQGQAVAVAPGVLEGLGLCDDADWFRVEVPAGAVLEVAVGHDPAAGRVTLRLFDEGAALLASGEGPAGAVVAFAPPSAAARTVFVALTSDRPLAYDLTVALAEPGALADLRIRGVEVVPAVAEPGATVELRYSLLNVGGGEAGPHETGLALVPEGGGAPVVLPALPVAALAGGAARAEQARLELPRLLPEGRYGVRLTADVGGAVDEADALNNEALGVLRVDRAQACPADAFEPNGSGREGPAAGAALVPPGSHPNLSVCRGADDWYAVELEAGQRLEARLSFRHADGDLDLVLFGPDEETELGRSAGFGDREAVVLPRAPAAGRYYLRVFIGAGDLVNLRTTYTLDVEVGLADACEDDGYGPNSSRESAALLPDGSHDLVLCAGDEDWYRFNIPVGNTVSFQVASGGAGVRLALFDPDGALLAEDGRRITHEARRNGFHFLRAQVAADDPVPYSLTVAGVSGIDLEVVEVSLSSREVAPGQDLRVQARVANRRGDGAVDVPVRSLLSADDRPSADDLVLATGRVARIDGAAEQRVDQRVTLPAALAPGAWFVIFEVDPERTLPDLRPANNRAAVALGVVAACVDDDDRENEGPRTATLLDPDAGRVEDGVICPFTEDWFRLPVEQAGPVNLRLAFSHADGDLDLEVYDEAGALLGASRTEQDLEEVALVREAQGDLLIRVDGFLDARNAYTLSWTLP